MEDFKFGSVGKPFHGCEIKIAADGEVLLKGPNIFRGYYKNEQATSETIVDGWLHTGDLGRIDEDGFLYITGRKKDIIITAGGKNITPANLENGLKQNQYISQAVVYGDRRPYLTALITLDPEEIAAWANEHDLGTTDVAELAQREEVRELVQKAVDDVNSKVARVEQVKKFEILPHDLTQETGELTPTLKVKRNVVYEKYAPCSTRCTKTRRRYEPRNFAREYGFVRADWLARLAQQRAGRLLEDAAPGRRLLALLLGLAGGSSSRGAPRSRCRASRRSACSGGSPSPA